MAKKKRTKRGATGRKVTRKKKTTSGRGPGRKPSLAKLSVEDLQGELARRQRAASGLVARRDRLAAQLAEVEAELSSLGMLDAPGSSSAPARARRGKAPATRTGRRGRGSNARPLVEHMADALNGRTLGVSELADVVVAKGYVTTSPNFRTIVNQALIKNTDRFKKVSRGKYTAK